MDFAFKDVRMRSSWRGVYIMPKQAAKLPKKKLAAKMPEKGKL